MHLGMQVLEASAEGLGAAAGALAAWEEADGAVQRRLPPACEAALPGSGAAVQVGGPCGAAAPAPLTRPLRCRSTRSRRRRSPLCLSGASCPVWARECGSASCADIAVSQ